MGSKSGGGSQPAGNTTSTQTTTPWSAQQPYLEQGMKGAQDLYKNYNPQYFQGTTSSPMTGWQGTGLTNEANFGMNGGSNAVAQANNGLSTINSGSLVGAGNPYFQQMVGQIGQAVAPQIDSHFAANGRYGSGANANAFASALTNKAGDLAYQNYGDQISNMIKGAAVAPGIQTSQLQGIGATVDAGDKLQQQNQAQLNDQVNRYNFQQQLPYNKLGNFEQGVAGNYGGTSMLSQPYFQNKGANAMAGAGGGAALGGLLGGGVGYGGAGKGLGALAGLGLS